MRIRLFRSEKGGDWVGDGDEIFPITGYVKISAGIGRCLTKISPGSRVLQKRTRRNAEAADGIFEICKRGCRRRFPANCRAAVRDGEFAKERRRNLRFFYDYGKDYKEMMPGEQPCVLSG